MPAKLEIEIVDAGTSPVGAPPPPGAGAFTAAPMAAQPISSSSNQQSTQADQDAPQRAAATKSIVSEFTTISEGIRVLGKALGFDGVLGVASALTRAFSELYQAVKSATSAETERAQGTAAPVPDGAGSKAADDAIDVEFTDSKGRVHRPPGTDLAVRHQLPAVSTQIPSGAGESAAVGAAEGGAGLAAAAGPAILAIGALAVGVGLATSAVMKFVDSMKAEAEKLANYSPELAGATANSEIREMMGEMRRAEANGPQLAKFEDARSRISQQLYDLGTRVEGWLLSVATPVMQIISNIVPITSANIEVMVATIKMGIDSVLELFGGNGAFANERQELIDAFKHLEKAWRDAASGDEDPMAEDPFFGEVMGMDNGAGQLFGPQLPGRGRVAPGV